MGDKPLISRRQEVCKRRSKSVPDTLLLPKYSPPVCSLQVSLSAFAYLFSELVQYCQSRVSHIGELERRCEGGQAGRAGPGGQAGGHL